MKKLLVLTLTLAAFMAVNAQIEINSSGNVGIRTAPNNSVTGLNTSALNVVNNVNFGYGSYPYIAIRGSSNYQKLIRPSVNNTCYVGYSGKAFKQMVAYDFYELSDKRQKENIRDIGGSLNMILSLKGVKYDLKKEYTYYNSANTDTDYKEKKEKERKNKVGFLAQDVFKIIPEVVNYNDSADIYSINYSKLTPVLVEAIKEQHAIIEVLQKEVAKLGKKDSQKSGEINNANNENTLEQNTPNPFTNQTSISFTVADNATQAMLCIYDLNGSQLKCYEIFGTGTGNQLIAASELNAGMYLYSLIVDGKLIDTKRMVLTE